MIILTIINTLLAILSIISQLGVLLIADTIVFVSSELLVVSVFFFLYEIIFSIF